MCKIMGKHISQAQHAWPIRKALNKPACTNKVGSVPCCYASRLLACILRTSPEATTRQHHFNDHPQKKSKPSHPYLFFFFWDR